MRRAALLLIPLAVLALTACGGPDHGVVQDKRHSAGYWYFKQVCVTYNAKGLCSRYVPQNTYVPPSWGLDVYNESEHGWRSVSENVYETTEIGETVDFRG